MVVSFQIFGVVHEMGVYFCETLAQKIAAKVEDCNVKVDILFEVDFLIALDSLRKDHNNIIYYKKNHIVLRNGEIIGDSDAFIQLAYNEYNLQDAEVSNTIIYNRLIREKGFAMLTDRGRPFVFLEFTDHGSKSSDSIQLGTVIIELFTELCPKACENFRLLCIGVNHNSKKLHYKNCPIHRIVKDGWIQTGDIIDGSGLNSCAVIENTEDYVPDESFTLDFDFSHGGIVGYANSGAHSSGSQFFITMGPCNWMNKKYVGVGRVVQGYEVIRALNTIPVANQKPIKNIIISSCGMADEVHKL